MAVKKVVETWSGRMGSQDLLEGVLEYARTFRVATDDPETTEVDVLADTNLPAPFSQHLIDPQAIVVNRDAKQVSNSPCHWDVTIKYSTDYFGKTGDENPTVISWDPFEEQEQMLFDADGQLCANRAGDVFMDPPLTRPARIRSFRIERDEPDYMPDPAMTYDWVVNSDVFYGFEPKQVLCLPPRARKDLKRNVWRVAYELRVKPLGPKSDGWRIRVLNVGLRAKIGSNLWTEGGYGKPWPLKNDGTFLTPSEAANVSNWTDVVFKKFPEIPLLPLGL